MHKYAVVARGQDGLEVRSGIDLILVKKDMLRYVQNVRAGRGIVRGLLDHPVVLCEVRLVGAWIKRREVADGTRMTNSEKLREHQYR